MAGHRRLARNPVEHTGTGKHCLASACISSHRASRPGLTCTSERKGEHDERLNRIPDHTRHPGHDLAGRLREPAHRPLPPFRRARVEGERNHLPHRILPVVRLDEIGHVLGIGALWGNFGFLRNPSLFARGADTHFTGASALGAFDAAGGAGYLHGKVPVENLMGPGAADVHWREAVLATELMTPLLELGESHPLSAITIQSLADLGYEVDLAQAEEYTVPTAGGGGGPNNGYYDPALSLAGDVHQGPVLSIDPEGRVVEVPRL